MSVCVIPARGGSKRIPGKNVREFCGRPMISWSIAAAIESKCFDRVIVSTDDEKIAEIARGEGADVPFLRLAELADDRTPTVPVIADAIDRLFLESSTPVCCLYATAPFVTSENLCDGYRRLVETQAPFVLGVTTFAFPIQRALRRHANGEVEMFDPGQMQTRSQDLEDAWHDAGQFYWARAATWLSGVGIFENGAHGLAVPRYRVQDIDTEEDWVRAEWMMQALLETR
ncbi:MAG: pseudaminic acid cytidylyltransferase [Algiphilus sp.]